MVFGSSTIVLNNTDTGHAWYEIEEVDDVEFKKYEYFYKYDNGEFTGIVVKSNEFSSNRFVNMIVNSFNYPESSGRKENLSTI